MFLVEKRWEILRILAERPSSPIELSERLGTTVSYVSQQLKLLEAVGLVIKEKTGVAEKGKPRSVYSIKNELVYLTLLTKNNSGKKLVYLTPRHQGILNIWLLDDITLHYPIEKLFWKLEDLLGEIDGVFIERGFVPKVLFIAGSKEVKTKIDSIAKEFGKKIGYSYVTKSSLSTISPEILLPLHDPHNILNELKEVQKI